VEVVWAQAEQYVQAYTMADLAVEVIIQMSVPAQAHRGKDSMVEEAVVT
jgi:hypothetical protein